MVMSTAVTTVAATLVLIAAQLALISALLLLSIVLIGLESILVLEISQGASFGLEPIRLKPLHNHLQNSQYITPLNHHQHPPPQKKRVNIPPS